MNVQLFAGSICLGLIESKVIDASMGVVGGLLKPSGAYIEAFQALFRLHTAKPDWDQLARLNLKGVLLTGEPILCAGGICVTDSEEFDEIAIE
ncbi:hypothetical protein IC235_08355 [Hymenobacter sp. BT664]|uniref:Uncharacterized protein n=1 Tax=Hymenobacter montanus TaxID=2771359 RepID=A0A927GJ88_9BACT|nr:hypothetical protein [Hymenobacter montanus]MBD2767904.1 hypothetical protein [Hymenobacter montanus]